MTEKFILRKAEKQDYPDIHALLYALHRLHVQARPDIYRQADPLPETEYQQLLQDENTLLLAAFDGERAVGVCQLCYRLPKSPLLQPVPCAFIEALAVSEDVQRQGVGKQLFLQARALARERGAARLSLNVWSFNEKALSFYRKMGLRDQRFFMEEAL
ncbi:MAG: GNAT family N-acetyltransferase [Provencibacterium sp.]|jgi:ribosomal protein S18 acetylase RimI-like enzyme|nr:GNAT family N-acetyltransferase [Provencibacterium sp.]